MHFIRELPFKELKGYLKSLPLSCFFGTGFEHQLLILEFCLIFFTLECTVNQLKSIEHQTKVKGLLLSACRMVSFLNLCSSLKIISIIFPFSIHVYKRTRENTINHSDNWQVLLCRPRWHCCWNLASSTTQRKCHMSLWQTEVQVWICFRKGHLGVLMYATEKCSSFES